MTEKEEKKHNKYINHYLNDVYTKEEAQQFLNSINEDSTTLEEKVKEIWAESELLNLPTQKEKEALKKEAFSLLDKHKDKFVISIPRRLMKSFTKIAASIVIIFMIGFGGIKFFEYKSMDQLITNEMKTSYGEIRSITLPDGTIVKLNSCSQISYPEKFNGDSRKIHLTGEAYFEVAKKENQPFIVETKQFNVKVLGTIFNIKAYDGDEIRTVSVESGRVQIDMPEAMMRLVANERMNYNIKLDEYNKHKGDDKVGVWRDGYFLFEQTPFMDVVRELERAYNCKIKIKDEQVFDHLISGEHPSSSLENILKSIQLTTGIKYSFNEKVNEILLYK